MPINTCVAATRGKKRRGTKKSQKLNQYWGKNCILQKWLPSRCLQFAVCHRKREEAGSEMLQRRLGLFLNARACCPRPNGLPLLPRHPLWLTFLCNKHTFNYQQPENPLSTTSVIKWSGFWMGFPSWENLGKLLTSASSNCVISCLAIKSS